MKRSVKRRDNYEQGRIRARDRLKRDIKDIDIVTNNLLSGSDGALKIKKIENVVNYVTILDCNYRKYYFYFVHFLLLLSFSTITAFQN